MKKTVLAILIFSLTAFASCGLLDITPDGRESLDEIFADNDKTAAYLNSCYGGLPEKAFSYEFVQNAPTCLSDEAWLTYKPELKGVADQIYSGTGSASTHPLRDDGDYYATYLYQIRVCTIFLSHIGSAKVNSENDRSRWTAEAHVLKAYYMLEMIKWFGSFGYDPDGFTDDYDYSSMRHYDVWELAEFVADECDEALESEYLPWRIDNTSEQLRVTKALAWCIKSKAYLFAASPLYGEDFTDTEKSEHWKVAYEQNLKAVRELEANGYALKTEIADNSVYSGPAGAYHELFSSPFLNTSVDRETIWQRSEGFSAISHNFIGSEANLKNATRAGACPTQELVDAYDVLSADGLTAEPLLDPLKPYNSDKTPNYNAAALALGYDPASPYSAKRDPRMDVTVIKNGDFLLWDGTPVEVETFVGGDNGLNEDIKEDRFTRTGYYFRKYVAPDADAVNTKNAAPWKYFRLAEIKLNLAEAAVESGNLSVAKAQVDEIRSRVSMPALPSGLSQESLRALVRKERMVELCYEECRYFDVRRWAESYESSSLYKDFKLRCNTLTAMYITKDPVTGVLKYERRVGGDLTNNGTKPRDLLLPIPEDEAQTLYTLTNKRWQNTGW